MIIGSQEHYDILKQFEKIYYHLFLEREKFEMWKNGQVYQNGEANNLYKAFIHGYSCGRRAYLNN